MPRKSNIVSLERFREKRFLEQRALERRCGRCATLMPNPIDVELQGTMKGLITVIVSWNCPNCNNRLSTTLETKR